MSIDAIDNAEYLVSSWWKDPLNHLVAIIVVLGLPLLVEVFRGRFWAQPALQVYVMTASVLAFLWTVRKLEWRRHTPLALAIIAVVHALLMLLLILLNWKVPEVNDYPRLLYGCLAPALAFEIWIASSVLKFLAKKPANEAAPQEFQ